MSSDIIAASLSTKHVTFSRLRSGWLFREDKTVFQLMLNCCLMLPHWLVSCKQYSDFRTGCLETRIVSGPCVCNQVWDCVCLYNNHFSSSEDLVNRHCCYAFYDFVIRSLIIAGNGWQVQSKLLHPTGSNVGVTETVRYFQLELNCLMRRCFDAVCWVGGYVKPPVLGITKVFCK